MTEPGVFAVARSVWDHPAFDREPFTQREAWLWMISSAAWAPKRIRVGHGTVVLERGQLLFATRFLAKRWQWSHSRAVRFLKTLISETMVTTEVKRGSTLITICNYDKYAFGRNADETQIGTLTGTTAEQPRNKEEEVKKLRRKEEGERAPASLSSKQANRGCRLPDGWKPPEEEKNFAIDLLGLDGARLEFEKFRDYWRSQPGARGIKSDWSATWRNWCRRAVDDRKPRTAAKIEGMII